MREQAILRGDAAGSDTERPESARAAVRVASELDVRVAWDLVLVTVLAPQLAPVLPALEASAARRIMFMFNTFEPIAPLRDAVGAGRFSFGFPMGVFTLLIHGKIHPQVRPGTTVDDPLFAQLFSAAGIPTVVERDMQSWLRSHAALVAPLMAIGVLVHTRGAGATWGEAAAHARAFAAGFALVHAQGNPILPKFVGVLASLPAWAMTPLFWILSRGKLLSDLGRLGTAEPRMLVDMMHSAALQLNVPLLAAPLLAIRP